MNRNKLFKGSNGTYTKPVYPEPTLAADNRAAAAAKESCPPAGKGFLPSPST
jgi:hypothetical protein